MSGRVVLLTGASAGIGAALARELAGRGDTLGLVGRREDRLTAVLEDCNKLTPGSMMWVADLGTPEVDDRLVAHALDAFGHVDVLINNAAVPGVRHTTRLTPDLVERVMQVNFHAPVRLTLGLLPSMLARGAGTIVNVSSLGGRLGIAKEAAYSASKFALCGWSESLVLDLWDTPIKIRLINPGAVDTDIWDRPGEERAAGYDFDRVSPESVAPAMADVIDSDTFEHYIPDMKSVAMWKAKNPDEFFAAVAGVVPHE